MCLQILEEGKAFELGMAWMSPFPSVVPMTDSAKLGIDGISTASAAVPAIRSLTPTRISCSSAMALLYATTAHIAAVIAATKLRILRF